MLKRNTCSDLRTPSSAKKQRNTFLSYRKVKPGEGETNQFIIKTTPDLTSTPPRYVVEGFLGCAYDLKLAIVKDGKRFSNMRMVVLQDAKGKLYLVEHEDGVKLTPTNTWSKLILTTLSSYMFVSKEIFSEKINNEHLFNVNTNAISFTPVGEGFENDFTIFGYPLTFVKSLHTVELTPEIDFKGVPELKNEIIDKSFYVEQPQTDVEFQNPDLSGLLA